MDPAAPKPAAYYLTTDEAATHLNLSPRTLAKLRTIGGGPRFRKFRRRVMYAPADLDAWANARVCESTSDPAYAALRL
jgi:helix-turn-helix protein